MKNKPDIRKEKKRPRKAFLKESDSLKERAFYHLLFNYKVL